MSKGAKTNIVKVCLDGSGVEVEIDYNLPASIASGQSLKHQDKTDSNFDDSLKRRQHVVEDGGYNIIDLLVMKETELSTLESVVAGGLMSGSAINRIEELRNDIKEIRSRMDRRPYLPNQISESAGIITGPHKIIITPGEGEPFEALSNDPEADIPDSELPDPSAYNDENPTNVTIKEPVKIVPTPSVTKNNLRSNSTLKWILGTGSAAVAAAVLCAGGVYKLAEDAGESNSVKSAPSSDIVPIQVVKAPEISPSKVQTPSTESTLGLEDLHVAAPADQAAEEQHFTEKF